MDQSFTNENLSEKEIFSKFVKIAFSQYNNQNYKSAIENFENALNYADNSDDISYCKTYIAIAKSEIYNDYYELENALSVLKSIEGNCYADMQDYVAELIKQYELLITFNKADEYINSEKYTLALSLLQSCKHKYKDYETRVKISEKIEYCEECFEEAKRVEQINKLRNEGIYYSESGKPSEAIACFKKILELTNDLDYIYQVNKAIENCENEMERLRENKAIDLYNEGVYYFNNQDYQKAIWKFEEAYRISGNSSLQRDCLNSIDDCKELNY